MSIPTRVYGTTEKGIDTYGKKLERFLEWGRREKDVICLVIGGLSGYQYL